MKNNLASESLEEYWNEPEKASAVPSILEASSKRPQLIYKHSYRCSRCVLAKDNIEEVGQKITGQADLHFIDVIESRPLSNQIAETLEVRHESPQLLLVHQGEVVWHASHSQITSESILAELKKI